MIRVFAWIGEKIDKTDVLTVVNSMSPEELDSGESKIEFLLIGWDAVK